MTRLTDSDILPANTIAASRNHTIVATGIGFDTVTVIANFTLIHTTITTRGTAALIIAAIILNLVAVITSLAVVHTTIAATLNLANTITTIARIGVTVIASLDPSAHHTITASSKHTSVQTRIGLNAITVITSLKSFFTSIDILPANTIAA